VPPTPELAALEVSIEDVECDVGAVPLEQIDRHQELRTTCAEDCRH